MSIRIGLAPGPWDLSRQGSDFLWEFIEATEAQGWDSLWFSDLITAPQFSLEPLTTLGAVAGRTRRLKFGTSVLAQAVRNPVITAKELATLDFISGGRMLPAVGLGTEDPYLYEACGVEKRQRAARVEEAVPLMRRLWREENVTHRGRFYGLQDISITPRPAREGLPVWIGGRSEAALHRVGRIGDGWLASSVTPEEVARSIPVIHQAARAAGRQIDEDHFGVLLAVYATEEGAAAARSFVRQPICRGSAKTCLRRRAPPSVHPRM